MNEVVKALRCHRFSGLDGSGKPAAKAGALRDVLSIDEMPMPQAGNGEILIQTHYAGVQYPDALQAQGLYQMRPSLPYVPGMDVAGTVLGVGPDVDGFARGDRVLAEVGIGGLSEVVVAEAKRVWNAPDSLDLAKCANVGRNYFAAYHTLKVIGEIGEGDLVVVNGASGGVGMAAIQLAKAMGALVIAGVSVEDKRQFPLEVGSDRAFCYGGDRGSRRAFRDDVQQAARELDQPLGAHLVIDMVQGDLFETLISLVRPLGRIGLVGFTAGQRPIRPGLLLVKQAAAVGSNWLGWAGAYPDKHQQNVSEILGFMASGAFEPRVDRLFSFADCIDAFELFETNQGRGNTVVSFVKE
ncbi:MAG: NADPH:quinone oxidoreductase family protein [Chromatiales bacterium]|jgi:NADPH:quinone reductase|nr:NADPH:quinone oxidoreductase family protein [Chromatiales bacterium]